MEIARIEVGRTTGVCTRRERIPAGIAGASVQVSFTDPVWDNLIKTVVFRGKETKIAEFDGAVAEIPHEVIPEPRIALYFGIFGHDPDTDLQIPLIEVYLGTTEKSTDANADPGADPTLPIWAQLKEDIADLTERVENMTPGGPGGDVNLDGYATEQWVKDQGYLTAVPDGYAKTSEIPKKAEDIGALPNTYTPPNQTAEQVGADPKGTAAGAVSKHNTSDDSHNDIRLAIKGLSDRVNAVLDSDDTTLDELSEIVAYIKSNKTLIEAVITSKVSVTDIINNLTTNVANKPLSAAQGVVLKGMIDAISKSLSSYALKSAIPTKVSQLQNDSGFLTQEDIPDDTVRYSKQELTLEQQAQAKENLGIKENFYQDLADTTPMQAAEALWEGRNVLLKIESIDDLVIINGFNFISGFYMVGASGIVIRDGIPYANMVLGSIADGKWSNVETPLATPDAVSAAIGEAKDGIVQDVIAALPVYAGEVEDV